MIKSLMLETIEEFREKQENNERNLRIRKEKLYQEIPRLSQIEAEMKTIGIQIVKTTQADPRKIKELIQQLKERSIDLQMERGELLASNGYPVNYLDMVYSCSKCQDTGFMGSNRCMCFEQRLIDKAYEQSNLHHILQKENFETFRMDYYSDEEFLENEDSPRKNMESIFLSCVNFTKDFDNHNRNLFFYGSPGLGKTFLSNAIAKDLLDKGKIVLYQTSADLIDFIRNNKFDRNNTTAQYSLLEQIFQSDLLIIDDLGTEYLTEFAKMELFNIINKRLLSGKKILISTNLSLREVQEKYPNRLTSRILGHFELHKFYGEDIRIKKLSS